MDSYFLACVVCIYDNMICNKILKTYSGLLSPNRIPSSKLTWQWNFPFSNRKYIFKWWIFHCYVSLPEGTSHRTWKHDVTDGFLFAGGQVLSDTGLPDVLHKAGTPRRRCVVLQVFGVENLIHMERKSGM